jgi:DNA-binding CsgD family transcriptional regulator
VTPDTSSRRLRAARELRGFARRAGPAAAAAGPAVLEALRGVVPYDCAQLARWDPVHGRHATVAAVGYPQAALRFLDRRMHTDPLFAQVHRDRGPLRVRDIPGGRRRGEIFDSVIDPLGFADGLTQCLFARDGRYLGMLNVSTVDGRQPDDDVVALLELLADDLATVLDPLPAPTPATRVLADGGSEGLLVTRRSTVRLSPGARADLTCAASPLRPVLDGLLTGGQAPRSHVVLLGDDVLAVTLEGGPDAVVVLHSAVAPPYGLTPRELVVLDAVSRGRTNAQIGRALRIVPRTVATHLEHVLAKTGAPNRTAAARLAARLGLLV